MPDQELADQFSQDVDELLNGHHTDRANASPDYRMAVDLAQVLATTDLSAESRQRVALRRRLLSPTGTPQKCAPARTHWLEALMAPLGRRLPATCGVLLAVAIIHLAWTGDLHRSASDLSTAFRENLAAVYAALPTNQPENATPISTTVGLTVRLWPAPSGPEALAHSQVPANSTTVALGNVTAFESPPK